MARSPAKRAMGTVLFIVALAVTLVFLFILYASSNNDDTVPFYNKVDSVAWGAAIVLIIITVALLLMLLIRRWDAAADQAESGEIFFVPDDAQPPAAVTTAFLTGAEVVVYDLRRVPQSKASWGAAEEGGRQIPFYFPRNVTAGVYVNDYIDVGGGRTLKLRTLMAGPYDPAYVDDGAPRATASTPEPAPEIVAATTGRQRLVLKEPEPEPVAAGSAAQEVYYDYAGDNHEIEDIEGIGAVYGKKLRALGVFTTARLAYEDTGSLAQRMEVPRKTVEHWKQMAELIKVTGIGPQYAEALVRAGIGGIAELKRRSPVKIADQVNAYLDTLDTNVLGVKITPKRVEGWQDNAKPMKRLRLQVPAQ